MLNDEQHEQLKKLIYKMKHVNHRDAFSDLAGIIDPQHWYRGRYLKPRREGHLPDEVLMDAHQKSVDRKFVQENPSGPAIIRAI